MSKLWLQVKVVLKWDHCQLKFSEQSGGGAWINLYTAGTWNCSVFVYLMINTINTYVSWRLQQSLCYLLLQHSRLVCHKCRKLWSWGYLNVYFTKSKKYDGDHYIVRFCIKWYETCKKNLTLSSKIRGQPTTLIPRSIKSAKETENNVSGNNSFTYQFVHLILLL